MSGINILELFTVLMIFIGTILGLLSAIGFYRLPDVYNRAHALSKSATLSVMFVLFGTFLYFLWMENVFSIKLYLGIFFVFLTSPISSHMILRSAYRSGVKLWDNSIQDDLADSLLEKTQE